MLPEVLKIGSFTLTGYFFFYILGIIFASIVIFILSRMEKFDPVEILNLLIFGIISGIAGAKLYGLLMMFFYKPGSYLKQPSKLLKNLSGGGVFYGGLFALILFGIFYTRKYFRGSEWRVFDITVVGVALGHVFGRLGCFSAGCCYGLPTELPWGVKFKFQGESIHRFHDTFVHPTQLYESVLNLINFIFLLLIWRRRKFEGQVFSLYLINYGFIRFFVEFFRNDGSRGYIIKSSSRLLSLSIPQMISIMLIVTGILLYRKQKIEEMI